MTRHHAALLGRGASRACLAGARHSGRTVRHVMARGERDVAGGRVVFRLLVELQV